MNSISEDIKPAARPRPRAALAHTGRRAKATFESRFCLGRQDRHMPAPKRAPKGTKKPETDAVKYNTLDLDYLRRQFDEFDKDKSGFLEEDECKAALAKIGSNLKFADLDTDKDHKISFEEFTVRASTSCTITR